MNNYPLEQEEHLAVAEYLRLKRVFFNHSPNEGKRQVQYVVKLKSMGMKTGFPDFFVYEPRGKYHGLALELKRVKGGRVSDSQKECLSKLAERGYKAVVCKGFDEAKKAIDLYLSEEK
jgi:hypothetical protein